MQFDWDDRQHVEVRQHGLTRAQIEYALTHGARFAPDVYHSMTEQRFITISRTAMGRPVFIAFCLRDGRIRPISARYLHLREARRHGI